MTPKEALTAAVNRAIANGSPVIVEAPTRSCAEERIERWVERRMDQLDRQLMSGKLTQPEYDHWVRDLNAYAERAYAELPKA